MTKRQHALHQLLSSERAFASDLALIRDIHLPLALGSTSPLSNFPATPSSSDLSSRTHSTSSDSSVASLSPPMTPEDAKIIFGNITEIAVFTDTFAEELELALGSFVEGGQGTDAVGALFLRIAPDLERPYNYYILRHPTALQHLQNLPQTPALQNYLTYTQTVSSSVSHAWDLASLLIKPVQRLLNYPLLLTAIIDETPDEHPDKENLRVAREIIEEVGRNINEGRRRAEVVRDVLSSKSMKKPNVSVGVTASVGLSKMLSIRHGGVSAVAMRVSQLDGLNNEAMKVEFLQAELKRIELFAKEFAKTMVDWGKMTSNMMLALRTWSHSFWTVVGIAPDQGSEAFDAFLEVIEKKLLPLTSELEATINGRVLKDLAHLLLTMNQPFKLIASMNEQEPYHYHLLTMPVNVKNIPPTSLLAASSNYLALRGQLVVDLPTYIHLLHKGLASLVHRFVRIQTKFWAYSRDRWAGLWEVLRTETELNIGMEETCAVWLMRWAEVDQLLSVLAIMKPVQDVVVRYLKEKEERESRYLALVAQQNEILRESKEKYEHFLALRERESQMDLRLLHGVYRPPSPEIRNLLSYPWVASSSSREIWQAAKAKARKIKPVTTVGHAGDTFSSNPGSGSFISPNRAASSSPATVISGKDVYQCWDSRERGRAFSTDAVTVLSGGILTPSSSTSVQSGLARHRELHAGHLNKSVPVSKVAIMTRIEEREEHVTFAQMYADYQVKDSAHPTDASINNLDTGQQKPTWTNKTLRRSTKRVQTREVVGDYKTRGNESSEEHGRTSGCSLFSVQSFEPQMKGLSSDMIVTVGIPPEGPTETHFTADARTLSTPSQSIRRLSFHSAISLDAISDNFSEMISDYRSSISSKMFESRSGTPNFRTGNESNRVSYFGGAVDWDKLSLISRETFETAQEPPPELLLALGLHLDPISCQTPLPTSNASLAESPITHFTGLSESRNEGPTDEEESLDSGNPVPHSKGHSPLYNVSFIRDVSNVCIIGSQINFTTTIIHNDDDVRVGLHKLYLRSDPTALHNSYERQMRINQQMKAMRAWGSQLSITSSSTPGEYPLSVPSIKARDLEEVVKDVFTWLYSTSSPHSVMWLYDQEYEGNLRTSLIGQCLANFLGERRDLTASYFYTRRIPSPPDGILCSGADGKDNPSSIIPTIAYELTRRIPPVKIPIGLTAATDLWIFDLSLDEQMKQLIVDPLLAASNIVTGNSYKFPQLFIIHGLEDCENNNFQELFLSAFGKSLASLQQSEVPQKLLLLGRYTAHLRECFSRPEMQGVVRHRLLPVSKDLTV